MVTLMCPEEIACGRNGRYNGYTENPACLAGRCGQEKPDVNGFDFDYLLRPGDFGNFHEVYVHKRFGGSPIVLRRVSRPEMKCSTGSKKRDTTPDVVITNVRSVYARASVLKRTRRGHPAKRGSGKDNNLS